MGVDLNKRPMAKQHILSLSPYVPGESKITGIQSPIKLSSNENPLGCSPKARAAFVRSASELHLYPNGNSQELAQAVSLEYGLEQSHIMCGNGSDELISLIASVYTGYGDEVLVSQYGFLSHYLAAVKSGASPICVEEKNYTIDLDRFSESITNKTRLIYIANPNNPTGSFISVEQIKSFHKTLPENVLLVIDAAYAEYIPKYDGCAELVRNSKNVLMLRTFSKIYGLAALRLGWLYADSEIITVLNRARLPFNVNLPAQKAGVSALKDQEFVRQSAEFNQYWRDWLYDQLRHSGYDLIKGYGNFLLVHFPKSNGKTADHAYQYLAQKGFITRSVKGYGLEHSLRISIGNVEDNQKIASLLDQFLHQS